MPCCTIAATTCRGSAASNGRGIVHRIDKDTSGLLVVAKNDFAHQGLSAQFLITALSGLIMRWCTECRGRLPELYAAILPAVGLTVKNGGGGKRRQDGRNPLSMSEKSR